MPYKNFMPAVTAKEDITVGTIKQILANGPQAPSSLLDPDRHTDTPDADPDEEAKRDPSRLQAAAKSIKAARAKGTRDIAKLFEGGPRRWVDNRRSTALIKAAWQEPQSITKLFAPGSDVRIDEADLEAIAARHRRTMRKQFGNRFTSTPTLPSESENNEWVDADYTRAGASHDRSTFQDEGTERPTVSHVGGYTDSQIATSDPRRTAPVNAVDSYGRVNTDTPDPEGRQAALGVIKQALSRPRRW